MKIKETRMVELTLKEILKQFGVNYKSIDKVFLHDTCDWTKDDSVLVINLEWGSAKNVILKQKWYL